MDGNGKPGRQVTEPATLLLIVCTRCLGLRKEPLGRATTVCGCGGRRRILRVIGNEPGAERSNGAWNGGAKRGGAPGGETAGGAAKRPPGRRRVDAAANGRGSGAAANGRGSGAAAKNRRPDAPSNGRS